MLVNYEEANFFWTTDDVGEPIMLASCLVSYLGGNVAHTSRIVKTLEPDFCLKYSDGKSGRSPWYLYEAGVFELTMSPLLSVSAPEKVRRFRRWAFKELFPSIRKSGAYISPDITPVQAVEAKEKLDRILDSAAPWERLYDENRNKGFAWFGYRFYNDYVYCFLTAEEWCKINNLNPVRKEANGRCDRLERIHQYIEPETKERLKYTVATILGFVDASNTPEEFQELYRRKYGRVAQLELKL